MLRDIIRTYLIRVAREFTTFYKTAIPLVVLDESIPGGVVAEKHLVAWVELYNIIASSIQYIVNGFIKFVGLKRTSQFSTAAAAHIPASSLFILTFLVKLYNQLSNTITWIV